MRFYEKIIKFFNFYKENEKEKDCFNEDTDILLIKTPRSKANPLRRAKTVQMTNEEHLIKTPRIQKNISVPGVLNLALKDLFQAIQEDVDRTFLLQVSYMEI